ncbi:hypothetical protein PYS58_19840 [Chryseobacterium indologenes]|uniref:hypothetical protein n=1 Tax=Chryseobacterium indologenes TaxID=253 RepID=UPI0023E88E90|nr:hypothetical protein [Chryseobacterium indologenes]WET48798.1 hypothetical protein PYS58_19840 [Chryseobacterium indologenes]
MKPIEAHNNFIPDLHDLDTFWEHVHYKVIDQEFNFITLLRKSIGGLLLFKGFQFEENDLFDWYFGRGLLRDINFTDYFLLSETVLNEFRTCSVFPGEMIEVSKISAIDKKPDFTYVNGLCLDGSLASLLCYGGAYRSKFESSVLESKRLAREFCMELFDEEYDQQSLLCWSSNTAWNSWFIDFIMDETFLILCKKTRTLWILAHTDQP